MSTVVTLAERRRRKLEAMRAAIDTLDARLAVYARQRGGRVIRFGSSATGRLHPDSDVDLLLDFPEHLAAEAYGGAEDICFELGLVPDIHDARWLAERFLDRVRREGVALP